MRHNLETLGLRWGDGKPRPFRDGVVDLDNDKPVWESHCTHCMACICYCPKEAIEYGKKSIGKPRYHFEALEIE